jgi:hypothetical protein
VKRELKDRQWRYALSHIKGFAEFWYLMGKFTLTAFAIIRPKVK